jgi:hypothetical protein
MNGRKKAESFAPPARKEITRERRSCTGKEKRITFVQTADVVTAGRRTAGCCASRAPLRIPTAEKKEKPPGDDAPKRQTNECNLIITYYL